MNPSRPLEPKLRLATASLLVGCLVATTVCAQGYPRHPYAAYAAPYGGAPTYAVPYAVPQMAIPAGYGRNPQVGRTPYQAPYCPPGSRTPEDMPDPRPLRSQQPGATADAQQQRQQPDQQQPSQQQRQDQQTPSDFSPSPESTGRASLTPGMNTPQLGRNDQSNRLNLFDNMAAAPQSRAWFGFQYSKGFDTALELTAGFQTFMAANPLLSTDTILQLNEGINTEFFQYTQRIYRVGGEWAPNDCFSVAVQGQYYATNGGLPEAAPDEWTNPQIMLKGVMMKDCDTILTATLGVTPESENERAEIDEGTTKIYPGVLFYEGITRDLFIQGGSQLGIPVDAHNEVISTDWSLALGYWLYRDCCPCGPGHCDRPHFLRAFKVTGIIPQLNVLGKHTVGDNQIVGPFGFQPFATSVITGTTTATYILCDPVTGMPVPGLPPTTVTTVTAVPAVLPEGFVIYREPRTIVDMTVGGQILFGDHIQLGLGYSFPLTGGSVRQNEFLSTLTFLF